jgi:hypothetical protein
MTLNVIQTTAVDFFGSIWWTIPWGGMLSVIAQTALVLTDKVQLTLFASEFLNRIRVPDPARGW